MRRACRRSLVLLAALSAAPPLANSGPAPSYSKRAAETMKGFTLKSHVGPASIPLPLDAVNFLLDHPDLSASLARRHRLALYRVVMRGPRESWADDGAGVTGTVILLKRAPLDRVYYAEGLHRSRLWPDIRASAVVFLRLSTASWGGCDQAVLSSFKVYVKVRNPFLDDLIRLLRPILEGSMLKKFFKALAVAKALGRRIALHPQAMSHEILSYPGLMGKERAAARDILDSLEIGRRACRR